MHAFKKLAIIITTTVLTCGTGAALLARAAGDYDWFPDSNSYYTTEPASYRAGWKNAGDTTWKRGDKARQYKRHKNTDTSIYIYPNYMGTNILFWGLKEGSNYKYCCSSKSGVEIYGKSTFTSNPWVKGGEEHWIINYVNERGCQYACLWFPSTSYKGDTSGVWSPDCNGKYDICNYMKDNMVP